MDRPLRREWLASFSVDVAGMLSVHRRGSGDPAYAIDQAGAIWRSCRTPDGPATVRVAARREQRTGTAEEPGEPARRLVTRVDAAAWGPGAGWLLGTIPALLGA